MSATCGTWNGGSGWGQSVPSVFTATSCNVLTCIMRPPKTEKLVNCEQAEEITSQTRDGLTIARDTSHARQAFNCRNIAITLKMAAAGILSVTAFHEKAGRSQVDSSLASLNMVFRSPAEWPLSPCFHPHSQGAISSLGACWAFSVQPVLLSVWRPIVSLKSGTQPRRLTQSPELGFGFCLFSSWNDFDVGFAALSYAAAVIAIRSLLCNGSYTSPLTHR